MPAKDDPASIDPSVPGDPERPPRPGPGIDDDPRWTAVSPEQPCPVCGATAGLCGLALEEGVVACANVPSEHPLESGGWLHQLARRPRAASPDRGGASRRLTRRRGRRRLEHF